MRVQVVVRHSASVSLLLAVVSGCGGAGEARSPEPKTAATPAAQQPQAPQAPPAAGSVQSTPTAPEPAWVDFAGAETALDASSGDCGAACRALGSMERACGRLCANTEQASRCDDSRARVRAARGRVRATCRACPSGPSLDEKAPIPST